MSTEPCDCVAHNAATGNFVPPLRGLADNICNKYDVTLAQLRGDCRIAPLAAARFDFYYHALMLGRSSTQAARFLNKDHTTVLYGASRYAVHHGLPSPGGRAMTARARERISAYYPSVAALSANKKRRRLTKDGVMLPPYQITPEEMERLRR